MKVEEKERKEEKEKKRKKEKNKGRKMENIYREAYEMGQQGIPFHRDIEIPPSHGI